MEIYSKKRKINNQLKNTLKSPEAITINGSKSTINQVKLNEVNLVQTSKKAKFDKKQFKTAKANENWFELIQVRISTFRDILMLRFFDELK